jgi:type 1 glutamine amidotransferase
LKFQVLQLAKTTAHLPPNYPMKMKKMCMYCLLGAPLVLLLLFAPFMAQAQAKKKIRVLLIDGQSMYHPHWPTFVEVLKAHLSEGNLFTVDHLRTPALEEDLSTFSPDFSKYDLVVSTFDGKDWPEATQKKFEAFVQNGGGFVPVHAANNPFPNWAAYNEMIGLGGWGGRNEKSGPYVYMTEAGERVVDYSPGPGGHHGKAHSYAVDIRVKDHPITKGLPTRWMHVKDELYEKLRGPAKNLTILASAYASPDTGGSGRHEPILMTIQYGKGRVFHTVLGHDTDALNCIGFKVTFLRGCEWAATGKVTQPVPANFPSAKETASVGQ